MHRFGRVDNSNRRIYQDHKADQHTPCMWCVQLAIAPHHQELTKSDILDLVATTPVYIPNLS
jgi:hypothetical protein